MSRKSHLSIHISVTMDKSAMTERESLLCNQIISPILFITADWLELPGALILLMVVAPSLIADTLRDSWVGVLICLAIACYLLQEHIRAAGGFRNSFTRANGLSNSIGIILLLVYPVWALVLDIL